MDLLKSGLRMALYWDRLHQVCYGSLATLSALIAEFITVPLNNGSVTRYSASVIRYFLYLFVCHRISCPLKNVALHIMRT
jgi:hypothetical protein